MKSLEGFEDDVETNVLADQIRLLERHINQSTGRVPPSQFKHTRQTRPSNNVPLDDIPDRTWRRKGTGFNAKH